MNVEIENVEKGLETNDYIIAGFSGTSMYPLLRQNKDMVLIEKVKEPLKKYDVPLYKGPNGKNVLHRILKVLPNGYIIRGDNLFQKEFHVTDDIIIGVLKGFYRDGKFYSCEKNFRYKLYVYLNVYSYPFRFFWKFKLRPFLSKIKRIFIKR